MGVSITKLPGAKPKASLETDRCPKCDRHTLIAENAEHLHMGGMTDRFIRCMVCGHRGPLGGLRVVK